MAYLEENGYVLEYRPQLGNFPSMVVDVQNTDITALGWETRRACILMHVSGVSNRLPMNSQTQITTTGRILSPVRYPSRQVQQRSQAMGEILRRSNLQATAICIVAKHFQVPAIALG